MEILYLFLAKDRPTTFKRNDVILMTTDGGVLFIRDGNTLSLFPIDQRQRVRLQLARRFSLDHQRSLAHLIAMASGFRRAAMDANADFVYFRLEDPTEKALLAHNTQLVINRRIGTVHLRQRLQEHAPDMMPLWLNGPDGHLQTSFPIAPEFTLEQAELLARLLGLCCRCHVVSLDEEHSAQGTFGDFSAFRFVNLDGLLAANA